jgi:trigger factor
VSAATVKHLDPTQVELEISITREELDAANERAFRQLVRTAKIPGFRPGKAPRKVFEAQYGSEIISERAMDALVPEAYTRALRENDLEPVDQPQMELLPVEEGQPLRLRATVNVRPEITLQDYKGVELAGPSSAVADSEVDKALESVQRESATLVPVDRPVEFGDLATLDYEGRVDGVPFEGGKAENQQTEVAAGRFVPGFVEGIVGMRAGETKDIEVQFPADYSNTDLAGKAATFTITVHEVKIAEYPPLDDEFAKRFNPESDLAGLRAELRTRLEGNAKSRARRALSSVLMDRLLAKHDFPLPAVMVERETDSIFQEAQAYVARAGLSWDDYLKQQERTDESVRAEYRTEAERRVKTTLFLEAVAKAEKIEATDKDVESEIAAMSRQYGQPRQAIIEMLRPNFASLVDGIVRSKTLDFLLDQAKITETPAAEEATKTPAAES